MLQKGDVPFNRVDGFIVELLIGVVEAFIFVRSLFETLKASLHFSPEFSERRRHVVHFVVDHVAEGAKRVHLIDMPLEHLAVAHFQNRYLRLQFRTVRHHSIACAMWFRNTSPAPEGSCAPRRLPLPVLDRLDRANEIVAAALEITALCNSRGRAQASRSRRSRSGLS